MASEVLKAYRFCLAPTRNQLDALSRHAGAARWAFNHALAAKQKAHEQWRTAVEALKEQGVAEKDARKRAGKDTRIPSKQAIQKALNAAKGDSRTGTDGLCPWWHEVNTYAFQSAFIDADSAWKNWLDSLTGARPGRRVGYPRFKKKGRCRDSFRLHHDVKKPTIRLAGYRRLRLPTIGELRLHESAKRMARLIEHGQAVIQSVTVSRAGDRWYASVLCKVTTNLPRKPTACQAAAGRVGVDFGVKRLATLSKPFSESDPASALVGNPRHVRAAEQRLAKAQRALSRAQKGSARREKARRRVARLHHEVAARRAGALHQLTKQLATRFAVVAVEDLHVTGMTRSARGSVEAPGRRVRQKAGLNKAILDASFGEFRRQLTYKTSWYGSKLAVVDRWFPSSKTCSACGWQNPHLTLADREFICGNQTCGLRMDRDANAARNIAQHAVVVEEQQVACDTRETENARGAPVSPGVRQDIRREASKREDTRPRLVPPRASDRPASFTSPGHGQAKLF